jgi:hypothetical protein
VLAPGTTTANWGELCCAEWMPLDRDFHIRYKLDGPYMSRELGGFPDEDVW